MSPKIIEVLRSGRYEQKEAAQLGAIIEPGEVILEVGAGIGFISTIAALHPNTERIEIFEANPELKPLIETVHRINQVAKATVNSGVLMNLPAGKTVPFYITDDFWASSLSPREDVSQKVVDVPAIDLNQTLRRIRPTLIICDIEGGELDLFEHAELEGVTRILMEIHQEVLGRENIRRLFDILSGKGFHYDQHHSFGQVVLFSHVTREPRSHLKPAAGGKAKAAAPSAVVVPDKPVPAVPVPEPLMAKWKNLFSRRTVPAECHLHVGAHHAAAGFIRRMVGRDQEALAARGIVFWDLKTTRANLTTPMQVREKKDGTLLVGSSEKIIRDALSSPGMRGAARVVMSDENLMGHSPATVRNARYGNIRKRMNVLPDVPGGKVTAFLTIRNTADFFATAYRETIVTRGYLPFDGFVGKSAAARFSWLRVYEDLAAVFGRENVVVFEFDTLISSPAAVISRLVGLDFELPAGAPPPIYQISDGAVEYIRIEREWKSSRRPSEVARVARARFPVGDGCVAFDPWTPAQRAALDANYQNDLRQIGCWTPAAG